MSSIHAGYKRTDNDHFHPDGSADPGEQRRRRGQLEQIDYTAYACNQTVVAKTLGKAGPADFQAMAMATARARAAWVAAGLKVAQAPNSPDAAALQRLSTLRRTYEELVEVYEAARRMVERGYLAYETQPQG